MASKIIFAFLLVQVFAGLCVLAEPLPSWPFSASRFGSGGLKMPSFGFPPPARFPKLIRMPVVHFFNEDDGHDGEQQVQQNSLASSSSGAQDQDQSELVITVTMGDEPPQAAAAPKDDPPKPVKLTQFHKWSQNRIQEPAPEVKTTTLAPVAPAPAAEPPTHPPTTNEYLLMLIHRQADLLMMLEKSTALNSLNAIRMSRYLKELVNAKDNEARMGPATVNRVILMDEGSSAQEPETNKAEETKTEEFKPFETMANFFKRNPRLQRQIQLF